MKNLILSGSILLLLVACTTAHETFRNHDNDYVKQAKTVKPAKLPNDLNSNAIQSAYPIPPVSADSTAPITIVPPGSQVAASMPAPAVSKPVAAPSPVTASSNSALVLNLPYDQAWSAVGRALHSAGYKVMQQDKSIGGYYIVDVASTGGKLQTNTPIYQVHVQASGSSSIVNVLNDKNSAADQAVSGRILGAVKGKL